MKNVISLVISFTFISFSSSLSAQNLTTVSDTIVTIETKSGGSHTGNIISESLDSIKIQTENFGIVTIAKKDIIYHNLYSVETVDGNEYLGEIKSEDSEFIVLNSQQLGIITIARKNIRKIQKVDAQKVKEGQFWFPNPQSSRYFWSPNGFGLEQGEGYYQNIWIFWNQFSYGLTDNFSIGAGIIPTFLFGGGPTPVLLTPKFSIPIEKDKINLGAGALLGTVLGESESGFGILYGLSTFGSRDNNVTIGLGYGFAGGEWTNAPLININGMYRISRRSYFITENYIIDLGNESSVILILGGRWIIKKAALDYGFLIPADSDIGAFVAIPWLGFTIPF